MTYDVTIRVDDGGDPTLGDTVSFQITVNEVNRPPTFEPVLDGPRGRRHRSDRRTGRDLVARTGRHGPRSSGRHVDVHARHRAGRGPTRPDHRRVHLGDGRRHDAGDARRDGARDRRRRARVRGHGLVHRRNRGSADRADRRRDGGRGRDRYDRDRADSARRARRADRHVARRSDRRPVRCADRDTLLDHDRGGRAGRISDHDFRRGRR